MKKMLVLFLAALLLGQPVFGKYVTVVFNFPEGTSPDAEKLVSVPDDANAFHAFVKVADEENLEMDMMYYPAFDSWFVNGINGVQNSMEQYWHFWVNNESSMVGISAEVPEEGDTIELGFADEPRGTEKNAAEKAVEWLVSSQKQDGEIGNHKVWGNSFALIALNLFPGNEETKGKAREYLLSNQKEDAGFCYPGFDSDALHTSVATTALIASDQNLESFSVGSVTPIDFLLSKQENDAGFGGWGSSDVDTTSWGITAFSAASQALPKKNGESPLDYLFSAQSPDGGFPYQAGQQSAQDYTAEALIAMAAAGQQRNPAVGNAIAWLRGEQDEEGCFSNSYTTALGAIALNSFGEDFSEAKHCLEGMQLPDNGFGRDGISSNAVDTGLAVIALTRSTLPTKKLDAEENPGLVPVGRTVKFTVLITNHGLVSAKNVSISLEGIPPGWVKKDVSETGFAEIRPSETVELKIYVKLEGTGQMNVFALVNAEGLQEAQASNTLSFEVASAELDVSLSMQG